MLALRFTALLALVVWIGGLVALGAFAAPAAFDVLQARAAENGRIFAGAVFGETLRRFTVATYACGVLLLLTLAARGILGPRPRRFAWRAALAVLMLAATLASGLYFAPRIADMQRTIGVAVATLPAQDDRRVRFGRLHALATSLQLVPLVGGLALLYWELKG
jgi:hypothetical protein